MADKDYKFTIFADDLAPCGPVGKENLDVIRLQYDFSCYLDTGESISLVQFPTIVIAQPDEHRTWHQDYPKLPVPDPNEVPPDDTYTLAIVSEAITNMGAQVDIRVQAGTPGFDYVMSFIIVGSTSRRRKQVDTYVVIEEPVNAKMIGPGQLDPDAVPPLTIGGSTALPIAFDGLVILENSGNASNIVITLPPNPVPGQQVEFIDALGKDELYPVTFRGDSNVPVDGDLSLTFVSNINFDVLRFRWINTNWHLEMLRFGFLG